MAFLGGMDPKLDFRTCRPLPNFAYVVVLACGECPVFNSVRVARGPCTQGTTSYTSNFKLYFASLLCDDNDVQCFGLLSTSKKMY